MRQLNIVGFDELNAMLIGLVVNCFQLLQNSRTRGTLIVVCSIVNCKLYVTSIHC